ncbi:MAG: AsmA-like C-terminal region-containing protein, partial [Phycisphaerae bacterium]
TGKLIISAVDQRVRLSELSGQLCGGKLDGEVEVDRQSGRYACRAVIQGADLGELVEAAQGGEAAKTNATGTVAARLYLSGQTGDSASLTGGGEVGIERARIFRLPLMLQILSVLGLAAPVDAAVQSASAEFAIQGPQVELQNILVRDNTVAMAGSGRLVRPGYLMDLRLVAVSPHRWFQMPVLTELVEGAARELIEIRVEGKLGQPVIRANPLRGVSGALETLLGREGWD